jgi:hypothetical protein
MQQQKIWRKSKMNKSIKYLLLTALTVNMSSIWAYTQHTYLNRRPTNVNLPMELTTFNERMQAMLGDHFGGNLQISGFYGETNGENIGNYFGINDKSTYQLTQPESVTNIKSTAQDFDLSYIIHAAGDDDKGLIANVSLDPKSTQYGARFDYYQNMDKVLKGLYLKVNTTLVSVENKMGLNVKGIQGNTYYTAEDVQGWVKDFFSGKYSMALTGEYPIDAQVALDRGLMTGNHSQTGFADFDVILGYKFVEKTKYHAGINLALTIPTGNKPRGVTLFESVYGNHSHFGFGCGLDTHINLWTKGKQDLKLNFVANYRYLFEASEHRPLRLKNYASAYVLLGDSSAAGASLIPAVNVLTRLGVDVTPGSQLDGVLALAYNNGGLSVDLGYNLYCRAEEDVDLKRRIESDRYGVAARNFKTATGTTFAQANIDRNASDPKIYGNWLTNSDIDVNAATTPAQFTNGIYGGLGYHFKKWEYPLLMGIGGKYDWASKNSEFNSWSIWAKLALSF